MEQHKYTTAASKGEGEGLKLVNRLSESRSPYVRGHMDNPVAWQMWTPETLQLAKGANRLIFVSIGYAACHWCHVMERESFENKEIANILNSSFIPIKIDREERPDVDRIYMNYVQATTGGGGWPLNVFLTPNLEPIFGGTYWPGPESTTAHAAGHIGFAGILEKMRDVWVNQRGRCLESAKEITAQLKDFAQEGNISRDGKVVGEEGDKLDLELLEEAYSYFKKRHDEQYGGFGKEPKFPTPANLSFLLRLNKYPSEVKDVVGEAECRHARSMAVRTLQRMARGGIRDQVGDGFARYSVTRDWSLPHFEKMLYDQPQLLTAYLDAYLLTDDKEMLSTATSIAAYLTTPPMHSSTGGFFSAEDADSYYRPQDTEKREGAFYVWTLKEFQTILGERDADVLAKYYDVQENGNVSSEYDAHDELINQNVLAVVSEPDGLAKQFGLSVEDTEKILRRGREKLREHREKERPRPALDDKIVVAWNGLAIGALARLAGVLQGFDGARPGTGAEGYLAAAEKAAAFIKKELYNEQRKTLRRVYREGPGDAPAFADDYAFLIAGLLDLYEVTFNDSYLQWADELQQTQVKLFWDDSPHGGFFSTEAGQEDLILRLKDGMDNAEPSANGVSAFNLYRLGSLLEDEGYKERSVRTCEAFEAEAGQHPFLFTSLMSSVVVGRLGMKSVAIVGGEQDDDVKRVLSKIRGNHVNVSVVRMGAGAKSAWLKDRNKLLAQLDEGKSTVQVCEAGVCRLLGFQEAAEEFGKQ